MSRRVVRTNCTWPSTEQSAVAVAASGLEVLFPEPHPPARRTAPRTAARERDDAQGRFRKGPSAPQRYHHRRPAPLQSGGGETPMPVALPDELLQGAERRARSEEHTS